jgi:hypothetical protein
MSELDRRADRVAQVQAQVDYHGQRLQLYRRLHGSHPSARLAELQDAYTAARSRLAGTSDAPPERERRSGRGSDRT